MKIIEKKAASPEVERQIEEDIMKWDDADKRKRRMNIDTGHKGKARNRKGLSRQRMRGDLQAVDTKMDDEEFNRFFEEKVRGQKNEEEEKDRTFREMLLNQASQKSIIITKKS